MEWMNDLFDKNGDYKPDDSVPYHTKNATIKERRADLSGVINELKPDVVILQEGPNKTGELQTFFDMDVDGEWEAYIQPSKGMSQCNGIAILKAKFEGYMTKFDTSQDAAFTPFELDNEADGITELYRFERNPVYVELKPIDGKPFRIFGIHLKSKGIFSALEWSKWWEKSVSNRKKILAQATQIRTQFLDIYLTEPSTQDIPLLVCGDVNDGPGMDAAEKRIFGSGIEKIMGSIWNPSLVLGNALYDTHQKLDISTTSYKDPIFNNVYHRVWIDHVLYTVNQADQWVTNGAIHTTMNNGKIWKAYPHASDHYPISVEVTV